MLNPIYHFEKMRDVLNEFEPSRELSLAKTKLEECELWLTKCRPTKEAVERDMAALAPGSRIAADGELGPISGGFMGPGRSQVEGDKDGD